MRFLPLLLAACGAACLPLVHAGDAGVAPVVVDRVGDTAFVQLRADSFSTLTARQQQLAYWLCQASIAIDPIIYDQLSAYGLAQKRLLEEILRHRDALPPEGRDAIAAYAKLFWANRGNHNLMTSQKILPAFSPEQLRAAALAAQKAGAFASGNADLPPLSTPEALEAELKRLQPALFDPQFEPMITAKTPQGGKDIIQASSTTFYSGVSLADLKGFAMRHPLNSRVVKGTDGRLTEEVYRAGTADGSVPRGLYATFLRRAVGYLRRAQAVAEPEQAAVIGHLVRYYETGEFTDWLNFGRAWVRSDTPVDFDSGFIEIYRDANSLKGSSQAFVTVTDADLTRASVQLSRNAAYFERKAPWLDQYKKRQFTPPVIKAVEALAENGDFLVSTIGDNLPNENVIRETAGTKNFLIFSSSRAISVAQGQKATAEFYPNPEIIARRLKYGETADDMLVALHEVIGHGSGKLSERMKAGSEPYLKEYYSTMEEARADLMALWNIWDPKLSELGLVQHQEEVAKAMYDRAAVQALMQLRQVPHGDIIEEDHQRDRALISNYLLLHTRATRMFRRGGKTYVVAVDYQKMHAGVGELLAEIMRCKAEGDYPALKRLIDTYGVHFDPALRDEVIARYRKLDLPTYWGGVNPQLDATFDAAGRLTAVAISYPCDPVHQYLRYGAMYDRPSVMRVLPRLTAADVPALAPEEVEAPAGKWRTEGVTRTDLPGHGLAEHPMLYLGEGYNKLFIVAGGKVVWSYSTGKGNEYDDAWLLSNGNVLFTRMAYISEVTPEKKVVWRYDAPAGTEIHACQPIGLDRVLYILNGLPPKLRVVNLRTGNIEVEHALPAKSDTDQHTVHPQFRRVRYTAQGTYLVPMLGLGVNGKVVEYDKDFKEIWSYAIRTPWAAIRLPNGNTLITDEADKLQREVNPQGETVWELKPQDLPEEYRYANTQTCTRLANGNTIVCSRGGGGKTPQLVEVTRDKQVVWALQDWRELGPATAVQVLDEPGAPEEPGESLH